MQASPTWHIFDTLFGPAAISFSINPFRLHELKLPRPAIEKSLATGDMEPSAGSHPLLKEAVALVKKYFQGQKIDSPWHLLDMGRFSTMQQRVYLQVAGIPYGQVSTYGQVAQKAGCPGAARFVGNCMAKNPYPVFIPCHRVIRSDGKLGGFGGGIRLKRRMLELEKAVS